MPAANGRVPFPCWRDRERERGYSFRTDAVKFARQSLYPEHASDSLADGDILIWFDPAVITHTDVPDQFIPRLMGEASLLYMGRAGTHSEIGFWAVRIDDETRRFLYEIAEMYRSGEVFALHQWHLAFVFDHCRRLAESRGMRSNNLTPGGRDHVWLDSPLVHYTEHLRIPRKGTGHERMKQR